MKTFRFLLIPLCISISISFSFLFQGRLLAQSENTFIMGQWGSQTRQKVFLLYHHPLPNGRSMLVLQLRTRAKELIRVSRVLPSDFDPKLWEKVGFRHKSEKELEDGFAVLKLQLSYNGELLGKIYTHRGESNEIDWTDAPILLHK